MPEASNPMDPPRGVPAEPLEGLYSGPLEEFTGARNALAKELRGDGKAAAADWVGKLQKPSRAAWLVNQLSARKSKEVAQLLELGRDLRATQEEMLGGSPDRVKLRKAAQREQRTVDSLTRAAEAIGGEHGAGAQIITRVGETLQAAAGDPAVAEAIERGRLVREQRAATVGLIGTAPPPARSVRKKGKGDEGAERRARQQAKRRQAAERKLATEENKLMRERAALERAREKVEEIERRVHSAELHANAARRELDAL